MFQWLEALGFCGEGEAGAFVAEGNTRLGGSLPVNTDGGACNVGRRHGANFCIEATRQLRGQCGERQVDGAEVAVFTNAVGPFSAGAILTQASMTLGANSRTGNEGVRKVALGAECGGGDRRDVGHRSVHDIPGDPTGLELGAEPQQRLDLEVPVEPFTSHA